LSSREKKIIQKKLDVFSPSQMAEIWKVNMNKKLDEKEMEQFEMLRKHYKHTTGKELPKHSTARGG
jgi:hypothetical protein